MLAQKELDPTRQSWVRELVDPSGTLPAIQLIDGLIKDGCQVQFITYNGKQIGEVWLKDDGSRFFEWLTILEKERPKGCGLATYVTAIEASLSADKIFRTSDIFLTADSVKICKILSGAGVATVVSEFIQVLGNKYKGDYRVYPK